MSALAALVDIDDAAAVLGLPPYLARVYLESHEAPPVAAFHGRQLWLSEIVHDLAAGGG